MDWSNAFIITLALLTTVSAATASSNSSLTCYDCLYYEKRVHRPDDDCLLNVASHDDLLQQCKSRDKFCKIEVTTNHGTTIRVERCCTETCTEECRWKDFVSMMKICTLCCQDNRCNA